MKIARVLLATLLLLAACTGGSGISSTPGAAPPDLADEMDRLAADLAAALADLEHHHHPVADAAAVLHSIP